MSDLVELEHRATNPGKPQRAAARVTTAPTAVFEPMEVQILGWPKSMSYEIPGSHWMPRANPALDTAGGAGAPLIPQVGDRCLVTFDHLGDAWVDVWG